MIKTPIPNARELSAGVSESVYTTRCALAGLAEIALGQTGMPDVTVSSENLCCLFEVLADRLGTIADRVEELDTLVALFVPKTIQEMAP